MAIFVGPAIALLVASAEEEKNQNRRDRLGDLSRSMFDISERVRSTHEALTSLVPKDEAQLLIWAKAISPKSFQSMEEVASAFGKMAFPAMSAESEVDIPQLFYRRFLMRKIELELHAVLACIKEALTAASGLKIALTTYEDLAKSGTIDESHAQLAKDNIFYNFPSVEIQPPQMPSNQKVFNDLHERDILTKVYMDEDPTLESTAKWLTTL